MLPPPPTHTCSQPTCAGIGVRESFNSNATGALLATGILDSLSAGVLLYVGLVQLVTPELTDGAWLHRRSWWMQASVAVVCAV